MSVLRSLVLLAFAVGAAHAQPDVAGVWELEAAEATPVEDALVFARLNVTEDRIRGLYIFLDPDDGELTLRRTRARYRTSDGQLIVRENNGVTVWDVDRSPTGLRIHDLESGTVLRMRLAEASHAIDPLLIGRWDGTRGGRPISITFRADGTAEQTRDGDHDAGDWAAAGAYLVLGDDPARYTVSRTADDRRQLVVEADGEQSVLIRAER